MMENNPAQMQGEKTGANKIHLRVGVTGARHRLDALLSRLTQQGWGPSPPAQPASGRIWTQACRTQIHPPPMWLLKVPPQSKTGKRENARPEPIANTVSRWADDAILLVSLMWLPSVRKLKWRFVERSGRASRWATERRNRDARFTVTSTANLPSPTSDQWKDKAVLWFATAHLGVNTNLAQSYMPAQPSSYLLELFHSLKVQPLFF